MSEDRFETIQKLWYSPDNNIDGSDVYWLISEVKRLRAALHETEMQSYGQDQ